MNPALKRQFEAATAVDKVVEKQKQTRSREVGTVLDYDKAKGFGFLLDADSEKIFVHQSQIVAPGFRMLVKDQKVSFLRGENRGKPWAEDVRNPDGTQISQDKPEETSSTMAKKRRQQLKEQWRNFFEIPQYAVKGYGESLPATVANQDAFALGETVPQLGKVFVMAHGCASSSGKGNEAANYAKEKLPKFIAKAYEARTFGDRSAGYGDVGSAQCHWSDIGTPEDVMNVALDAWGSPAQGLDGWEAASKAVVRTAQAQGPDRDSLACMAVQCWLLAKRAEKKDAGVAAVKASKPVDDGFDMFG
eukprot:Skav224338  [mRNA]  locus=scaffold1353:319050:321488:- [translate_table: standard]